MLCPLWPRPATKAGLCEAISALGMLQCCLDWDWAEGERSLRRAIELKSGYWLAHNHYAMFLSALGRNEEAVREVRRGLELEPLSLVVSHHGAWVFIRARLYDEAIDGCREAVEFDPNFAMGHYWLGMVCGLKSLYDEAIPALTHEGSAAALGDRAYIENRRCRLGASTNQAAII